MRVYHMGVFRNERGKPTVELVGEKDLSDFGRFTRGTVGDFITLFATNSAEETPVGKRQDREHEDKYVIHTYARTEGVCGVIITDFEYPKLVAHQLLSKILDEFCSKYPKSAYANATKESPQMSYPELKDYIKKYQNPQEADSIMKIQNELDETKKVLNQTIESVLVRGAKIDDLVAKSDGLSAQSKMFYTQAKKQNSCCVVM